MLHRSKNNVRILRALVDAELCLTNVQVVKRVWGEQVTMSMRVMASVTLKRLIREGYVSSYREDKRNWYEPTPAGLLLNYQWLPILRTCRLCNRTAKTSEELSLFVRDKRAKHGYANICKGVRYGK